MARLLVAMRAQLRIRFARWFAGSQALPGNPLRGGSASRNLSDVPHSGTRGRASQAVRSQAEPGNEINHRSVDFSPHVKVEPFFSCGLKSTLLYSKCAGSQAEPENEKCRIAEVMHVTCDRNPHGAASCRCATRPPCRDGRATQFVTRALLVNRGAS